MREIKNPDEKHMLPPFFFNYCSHFPRSQIYSTLIKYIQENINIYGIYLVSLDRLLNLLF